MSRFAALLMLLGSIALVPFTDEVYADTVKKADSDEDDNEKRLLQIQKEIAELHARIGKLTAEAARLKPPPETPWKQITAARADVTTLQGMVWDLRFSPDDRMLLCSNWSQRLVGAFYERRFSLWNVKTMTSLRPLLRRGTTEVFEFASKGDYLILAGLGEYEIQNTRTGKVSYTLPPPKDINTWLPDPIPLWISPDGETILRRHLDPVRPDMKSTHLQTIRVRTGKIERQRKFAGGFPVVSPDGQTVFTFPVEESDSKADDKGRKDYRPINSATAWNIANGRKRFTIEDKDHGKFKKPAGNAPTEATTPPRILLFSPDSKRFLWFQDGLHFHVADLASGATLHAIARVPFAGTYGMDTHGSMAFSPDGRMIALDGTGPSLWEVATGKARHWFPKDATCVLFSHDGSLLAAGGNATVDLWDVWGIHSTTPKKPLSEAFLGKMWKLLAREDAEKAFLAMRKLVQHSNQSAPLIQKRVQAYLKETKSAQVPALIRDLDSDEFRVRRSAEQKLRHLGPVAVPALRKAAKSGPSLECRLRAERILQSSSGPPTGPWLQALRAIEILEASSGKASLLALKALASEDALHPLAREAKSSLERIHVRALTPHGQRDEKEQK
jgi:WD40 repeat protein